MKEYRKRKKKSNEQKRFNFMKKKGISTKKIKKQQHGIVGEC